MGKYSNTKFEDSLKLIRPALEWAEKQNVERLSRFLLDSANIPMYCFSSGGPSSADDYLALLYETNQGMAKSLTPLMMTSISDEALRNAKIVITAGSGTGEDEKYTIARAAKVNPNGICGITRGNSKDNMIVKTLNGVTNNWFKYNSPKLKGFISSNSTIAMFGLFYKAFTQDCDIVSKLDLDLSPSHCFTYGARIEGAIPKINEIKNYIVLYSGWSRPVAQDFEAKMVESGIASVQMCDYRNFCHGRFIFVSKHLEDCALVLFLSPREIDFAKRLFNGKTYRGDKDVFPKNTAIITIETKLDNPLASIDFLIKAQVLFNEIAKACRMSDNDDPCNPDNPSGIDKRYPRSLEWGVIGEMGALNSNIQGSKGTLKGVSRKKVIKYDPYKSIEEIAEENDVAVPTILKHIREMRIDRNRDEHLKSYNDVWKVYINDSDIAISALAKKVKVSENTARYYLSKKASDFQPKEGKIGMVVEHPKVKELREKVYEASDRFVIFRKIYDSNPSLSAVEILRKAHWSEDKDGKNLSMVTHFMRMKEFKYRFKKKEIEFVHNEDDVYKHQPKKITKPTIIANKIKEDPKEKMT